MFPCPVLSKAGHIDDVVSVMKEQYDNTFMTMQDAGFDLKKNCVGSGADFLGGHTHAGMLNSAHWLLKNETQTLRQLLEENPTYDLHFIGHSLGAGSKSPTHSLLYFS